MKKDLSQKSWILLLIATAATILLRLLTTMEVNVGGDNIDYWYYAKALTQGYPYGSFFHRNIRWGMILPVSLVQILMGTRAWVIYVPPLLIALFLNVIIWQLAKRFFDIPTALFSIIFIQFFPYTIRVGSQLLLSLFSTTYLMTSLYFLLKALYPDDEAGETWLFLRLLISLLFLFIAYETKITNIYFLFPFLIILWRKKGFKTVLIYGGILFLLYLIEHLSYFLLTGNTLGRLGIILGTHFKSGTNDFLEVSHFDGTFLGLLGRFSLDRFPLYWHIIIWGGILSGIVLLFSKKESQDEKSVIKLFLFIAMLFIFILTFGVKSINPFIPFEDFLVRYFFAPLPLAVILLSHLLVNLLGRAGRLGKRLLRFFSLPSGALFAWGLPLFLVLALALSLSQLPSSADEYLNNPLKPKEHPFSVLSSLENETARLYKELKPVVSWEKYPQREEDDRNGKKPLDTVNRLLLPLEPGVGAYPMVHYGDSSSYEMIYLDYLGGKPGSRGDDLYVFYRFPFEMKAEHLP